MLPLPVALVNQVKMLQTENVTPKTQSNDNLTGWWRDCVPVFVCAIQIQDVSQIFSPTPFLFVRVYLSLLVSPAFIEANRLNACPTVPDHSPLNRISLRQPEDLKWSCLQASKGKRERRIDKDKLRLHLMNTISISHLFLHHPFCDLQQREKALHLTFFLLPSSTRFRLVPNLETLWAESCSLSRWRFSICSLK